MALRTTVTRNLEPKSKQVSRFQPSLKDRWTRRHHSCTIQLRGYGSSILPGVYTQQRMQCQGVWIWYNPRRSPQVLVKQMISPLDAAASSASEECWPVSIACSPRSSRCKTALHGSAHRSTTQLLLANLFHRKLLDVRPACRFL